MAWAWSLYQKPQNLKNHLYNFQEIYQLIIKQDRLHNIMITWINPTSQFHQIKPNWTKSPIWVVSSPRNSKFSQFNKLIKLNRKDHVYSILQQNPLINFERKGLKQQKSQKSLGSKFPKYAWNLKINEKGRVIWSYRPWERKTLQKDQRKTTKNWLDALTDRIEREKVLKSLKSVWTREKERFLKNSLYDFQLIEK